MDQTPVKQEVLPASRWRLIRDLIAFQFKLILDGLRDILLSPISMVAALAGLLTDGKNPGKYFYRLMALGHKSDGWLNLFKTHDKNQEEDEVASADSFLRHAENIVLREYEKGGVVSNLKHRTDRVFDSLSQKDLQGSQSTATDNSETGKPHP